MNVAATMRPQSRKPWKGTIGLSMFSPFDSRWSCTTSIKRKWKTVTSRSRNALSKFETPPPDARPKPKTRARRARSGNGPRFPLAEALLGITRVDLTEIPGLGSYAVLQLVGETGCDMSPWKSAKHFTAWLALAPNNKESAGRIFRRATPLMLQPCCKTLSPRGVRCSQYRNRHRCLLSTNPFATRCSKSYHGYGPQNSHDLLPHARDWAGLH